MIDMVIIGHISKDRILVENQTQEAIGGAAYLSYRLNHTLEDSLEHCLRITNLKLRKPGAYCG